MATTPSAGESLQALTIRTWVLKVSIHCEGCKKKVKKVLHNVEGVYNTNIDTKQQKVTVTGNVEAETLINKLVKSGKKTELWPEPIIEKKKKSVKLKKKEKQIEQSIKSADKQECVKEVEKEKSAIEDAEVSEEFAKKIQVNSAYVANKGDISESAVKNREVAETNAKGKKLESGAASIQLPGPEIKCDEIEPSISGSGSGSGGKKKHMKGRKSQDETKSFTADAPAFIESTLPIPINHSPPHHGYDDYQPHYHAPPPAYGVSYNTVHPSSSYTASYYASPPPYSNAYAYAYTHTAQEVQHPPPDIDLYSRQPLDSFEMFSDENPNGCCIM